MNPQGPRRVSHFPSEAPLPQDSMTFQNSATSWAPGVQTQEMMGGVSFSNDKMTENFRLEKQEVLMHVTDSSLRLQVIQNRFPLYAFLYFLEFLGKNACFCVLDQWFRPTKNKNNKATVQRSRIFLLVRTTPRSIFFSPIFPLAFHAAPPCPLQLSYAPVGLAVLGTLCCMALSRVLIC